MRHIISSTPINPERSLPRGYRSQKVNSTNGIDGIDGIDMMDNNINKISCHYASSVPAERVLSSHGSRNASSACRVSAAGVGVPTSSAAVSRGIAAHQRAAHESRAAIAVVSHL